MDGSAFDNLARRAATVSRRDAFTSACVSVLAALGAVASRTADEAAAKKKHKKKRKRKRKKKSTGTTPAPPPGSTPPPSQGCVPQCAANKPCGPDGCTGSCGTCTGNDTCQSGQCVCVPQCNGATCGDDGCGGECTCPDTAFCQAETCVPCDPPCPAGERCIHGTCTCDAFNNQCPMESATNRCSCGGQTVDGVGGTCADKFSACDLDKPCTTHDDCPVGSVCKTSCVDPDNPLGPNRCSTPCVPV